MLAGIACTLSKEDYATALVNWVMEMPSSVTQISAGEYHFAALTDEPNFNLYTWGKNESGQLGHGDTHVRRRPTQVMGMEEEVTQVQCGGAFTTCITKTGKVMAWGDNSSAQVSPHNVYIIERTL